MYKIIIADDEQKIRELLPGIIEWELVGFELCGVFSDGKEVIDYINHNHVDLILSDLMWKR